MFSTIVRWLGFAKEKKGVHPSCEDFQQPVTQVVVATNCFFLLFLLLCPLYHK